MNNEPCESPSEARVVDRLRALARADAARGPSPAVEAALMAAFDAHHRARSGGAWTWWIGAAAAVLVMAAGLALATRDITSSRETTAAFVGQGSVETTEFVLWPGAATLPAFESGELVRMELPVSVLPLLGIPLAEAPAGDSVTADVLYAQDGLARAVRIVKDQSMNP